MFMGVNSKCAHQVRPPLGRRDWRSGPSSTGTGEIGMVWIRGSLLHETASVLAFGTGWSRRDDYPTGQAGQVQDVFAETSKRPLPEGYSVREGNSVRRIRPRYVCASKYQ